MPDEFQPIGTRSAVIGRTEILAAAHLREDPAFNFAQRELVACAHFALCFTLIAARLFLCTNPRRDKRVDFVGGIRGLAELERRVDSGEMAVAFSLFPTGLADLMAVADAEKVMPPKSTWFEPKLADGLVSHLLDP